MNDLEHRLRNEARQFGTTAGPDLADRIIAAVPAATRDRHPHPLRFPAWAGLAAAAGIALALGLSTLRQKSDALSPAPETVTATAPAAAPPVTTLPSLSLASPWRFADNTPLDAELANLEADVRSAGRFLAERLPDLARSGMP